MKKQLTLFSALVLFIGLMGMNTAWGQIAGWDFRDQQSTDLVTYAATTFNSNLVATGNASDITRGTGATASTALHSFRTTGFQDDGISVSNTDYFQITLSPQTGYTMSLTTINARVSGTTNYAATPGVENQFAYSTNGTDFTLIGSPSVTIGTNQTFSIDVSGVTALQDVPTGTTVYLRYYASGQTTTGGWGFFSSAVGVNGLAIEGTVDLDGGSPTPLITVTPTSLSGFTYEENSGPSTEQTFVISGANLEANISITPPINYEISKTSGSGFVSNPATLTLLHDNGTVGDSTIYVRLKADLTVGNYNSEDITASSTNATNKTVACSGSVTAPPDPEPTSHATNFTATVNSHNQITVTWTDATGAQLPAAYLVKAAIDPATPTAPADGTVETNDALVKNIDHGVQEVVFTGLNTETIYNFAIWPYTNSGAEIDYKLGIEPTTHAQTLAAPISIFSETMGIVSSTTAISSHTGWDNTAPVAFSGTADVRSTLVSNYPGASGGANIFITNTEVGRYFLIEGIDVRGYKDITLSFGQYKSNVAANNELEVAVSSDGVNWTNLSYTRSDGAVWAVINPTGSIPANVSNLRLRFTQSTTDYQFRVDDIKLFGYAVTDATYNTIAIDGVNSGWNAGEVFSNVTPLAPTTAAEFAHFTWDADYLYFAISGTEAALGNMATYMIFNTAPHEPTYGTTDVYAWDNNIVAPFKANIVFVWKNETGADYMELITWDATAQAWGSPIGVPSNNFNLDVSPFNRPDLDVTFAIGADYREIKIPRLLLGVADLGDQIKVASFTEQRFGTWRYFGWPAQGWTDGDRTAGQTMTHAYHYTLEEFVYPNEAQYLKKDIIFTANATIDDAEYDNVYIEPNTHIEVNATQTLTVNGNFTILSDDSGTGSFIDNGTLVVHGTTTVEKYLPNSTTEGWYLSSPLSAAPYSTFAGSDGLFYFDASSGSWAPLVTSETTPLVVATGYVSRFVNLGGPYTAEFTGGNLNTDDITTPTLHRTVVNFGWNLVGNPYPSTIDWNLIVGADNNAFVAANSVSATIYLRKADGNVAYYNANAADGTNGGTRYIAPMQAFWVQVDGDNGNITNLQTTFEFLQTARVNNAAGLLKSNNTPSLRLSIEKDGYSDEALINFNDNATINFDAAYDGKKMFSDNDAHPQIYSVLNNNVLAAINSLPTPDANTTVALGFLTNNAGQHTISVGGLSNFDSNVSIHLEDTEDNVMIDLHQQNVYTFSAAQGTANDRFVLHFGLTTTATETLEGSHNIGVYANEKNIYISNAGEKATVSVFNMLGQEVVSEQLQSHTLNKITTNLSTGQYVVRVTGSHGAVSERVFIN